MKKIIFAGLLPKKIDSSKSRILKTNTPEFFDFENMNAITVDFTWDKIETISRSTGIAGNYEIKKYTSRNGVTFLSREPILL